MGGKGRGQSRPGAQAFPGLHWATYLLDSLSHVSLAAEKPIIASRCKGENLKLAKSAGGPYIPPRKAGKRKLEGIWGQETKWNRNKNPELGTQKVELRIQN